MQYPIVYVGGWGIRLDCITHYGPVEQEPDAIEVFFIDGSRNVFFRDEAAPIISWFKSQAWQRTRHGHTDPGYTHASEG